MSDNKPIKKVEIMDQLEEGGFDFGWLDLDNARSEEAISNRLGLMQRKINELVDFANRRIVGLTTEEEQLQHSKVLSEMSRLLPKTVADQLDKAQRQAETQEWVEATAVLIEILEKEERECRARCGVDWSPTNITRLRMVEGLLKPLRKEKS
jgi:hypothetical protein